MRHVLERLCASRGFVGFGPMNVLAFFFFLAYIAFNRKIAIVSFKEGTKDHECKDQTLCNLERWV
jgi:hypothetical protein